MATVSSAAASGSSQVVPDVHAFPGHIACDVDSRSELVVPVIAGDQLVGVLDLDSPLPGRFSAADQAGAEALVARIAGVIRGLLRDGVPVEAGDRVSG